MPKSVRQLPEAVEYLRQVLSPKKDAPLHSLESLLPASRGTKSESDELQSPRALTGTD